MVVSSLLIITLLVYLVIYLALVITGAAYTIGIPYLILTELTDPVYMVLAFAGYGIGLLFVLSFLLIGLKSFFSTKSVDEEVRNRLDPQRDVEMYNLVERVASELGAPAPAQIKVCFDVNASASFSDDFLSFLRGKMALTLGLPLIEVMSQKELASIVAHELGHFAQGGGMRLSILVRRITAYFARIVYERDHWDEVFRLDAERWGVFIIIPFCFWLIRFIFRLFMRPFVWFSHFVSMNLLREMEFDADKCAVYVSGKETFKSNFRLMYILELASQHAHEDLIRLWREQNKVIDSYPQLVETAIGKLSQEELDEIETSISKTRTGLFDSHPATGKRIKEIEKLDDSQITFEELPARSLLKDYETLATDLTQHFNKLMLGKNYKKESITRATDLSQERKRERERSESLDRYFQGLYSYPLLPIILRLPPLSPPHEASPLVEQIKKARERLTSYNDILKESLSDYMTHSQNIFRADASLVVIKCDVDIKRVTEQKELHSKPSCEAYLRKQYIARRKAEEAIKEFEKDSQDRFINALRLSLFPENRDKLTEKGVDLLKLQRNMDDLASVSFVIDMLRELEARVVTFAVLISFAGRGEQNISLNNRLHEYIQSIHSQLSSITLPLQNHDYPFEHASGKISMAQYALPEMPHPYDLEAVFNSADMMISNIHRLYFQLFGTLAETAQKVEELYGMEKLPEPNLEETTDIPEKD